jgi:penicillin-binding protein 1A
LRDGRSSPLIRRIQRLALGFDAWLNASLYDSSARFREAWENYRNKIDKLSLRGTPRAMADLAGEATNIGLAVLIILLVLAIPAFRETDEEWLKTQELAVTFLDRYGNEIGHRGIRHDDSIKLEEFPDHLIKAALATEDRRFFDHWGIDPVGTVRALSVNARASGVVQGGSTITQQLAKNLFLTNERSLERKMKEAFLAVWLEYRLTKQQILKLYLDRAYMGGGTFGVTAAADYYFGKSIKDVNLAEAAMLAGLFKAPARYAPHINLPAARARANDVLSNMVEAGFITEGQVQSARRNPATPIERKRDVTPDYYLDWAFDEVKKLSQNGKLGAHRVLTVKTPLDLALQRQSEQALENTLRQHGADYEAAQGAIVVMDPDGALRAMVGGRDYGMSQFNRATDALRQPGSAFKPFVYAAALSAGLYHPATIVTDSPVCIGNWCPANYGRSYAGSMPLTTALAKSINTIPVKMSVALGRALGETHEARAAKLGRAKIIDLARRMGLNTALVDTVSLPIGAAEVTVLDMTAGYAVFANGGREARPYAALDIQNSQGETIFTHERSSPSARQVLATGVVADMNVMLSKVPEEGTGRRAALEGILSAGKTGTTNGYRDAWYVGYTGNLVSGIWFGNDDYASTNRMTGGSLPAMTWKDIMTFAHRGLDIKPLPGLGADEQKPGFAVVANNVSTSGNQGIQVVNAQSLSRRSFEVVNSLNKMFQNIERVEVVRPSSSSRASIEVQRARGGAGIIELR